MIDDLYQTKIECLKDSNSTQYYNVNQGSTDVKVVVSLIDFNGNAVSNKSVTLSVDSGVISSVKTGYTGTIANDNKSVTGTTNSYGKFEVLYTASTKGLITFSCNQAATQLLVGAFSGSYNDLTDTPNLSESITVTKLTGSAITSGMLATYEIKAGNTSLGKIDIPKDFLVKSGSLKTCSTANNPVSGYVVGDKYIEFVINTKDSSGTNEKIYVKVSDLISVDSTLSNSSTNPIQNKAVKDALDNKAPNTHTHTKSQITDFPSTMPPSSHSHTTSDISNFPTLAQVAVSGSYNDLANQPTIPTGSSTTTDIKMNGTQSAGSSSNFAKADHVHPTDTSRAASNHNHDGTYLKTHQDISGKLDKAQGSTNATKNVVTDSNGNIAFEAKPTIPAAYTHPTPSGLGGAKSSGLYKISTDANGHVTGTASVSEFDLPQHTHYDTIYVTTLLIEDLQGDLSGSNFAEIYESEGLDLNPAYQYVIRNTQANRFCTYGYNNDPNVDNWVLLNDSNPPTSNVTISNIDNVSTVAVVVTYTDDSTETLNLLKYTPPSN